MVPPQPAQHLADLVELGRSRQVGQIAGVHHEIRAKPQGVHLVDGAAERAGDVGVRRPVETQVAVADLDEPQRVRVLRDGGRGAGGVPR